MKHTTPDFILYALHGWSNPTWFLERLAQALASPRTHVLVPNLGYLQTWISIEPLIQTAAHHLSIAHESYPKTPIRLIGYSLGGHVAVELLTRTPFWLPHIESLVLLGSPMSGAHLARMIDPLHLGIGIARDLGTNRRHLAEQIAHQIPTMVIAGDMGYGNDGLVSVESTKVAGTGFTLLPGLSHTDIRIHPRVAETIRHFWANPAQAVKETAPPTSPLLRELIRRLQAVPGMTDAPWYHFDRAHVILTLHNGATVRLWTSPLSVDHIFLATPEGQCCYSGYVGWAHRPFLQRLLESLAEVTQEAEMDEQMNVSKGLQTTKDRSHE